MMTQSEKESRITPDDPIVAEVRLQRDSIAAALNYDLDALVTRLQSIEDMERNAGRRILPSSAEKPGAAP